MKLESQNWSAWYNLMPPGPHTLIVTGTINVGNNSDSSTIVFDSIEKSKSAKFDSQSHTKNNFYPQR